MTRISYGYMISPADDHRGCHMQDVPTIEKKVRQPTKKLPTDRLAFDKQIALLRGWVAASGATGKAGGTRRWPRSSRWRRARSLANPFFVETGLLQKANGGFLPVAGYRAMPASLNTARQCPPSAGRHDPGLVVREGATAQAELPATTRKEAVATLADESDAWISVRQQAGTALGVPPVRRACRVDGDRVKPSKPARVEPGEAMRTSPLATQPGPEPRQRSARDSFSRQKVTRGSTST